jgi:hypothetical protein
MSPEQMVGGEMTPASDIYTLGVVIYEMISGRTPFADAKSATAILAAVLTQTPEPLSRYAPVPPALEQIVARCLERELPNRFADITELTEALAAVTAGGFVQPGPPAVPSTGFEQPMLSAEATRIDVRFSESSEPVLDARGPRYRAAELLAPAPAAILRPYPAPGGSGYAPPAPAVAPAGQSAYALGSYPAIDASGRPTPQPMLNGQGPPPGLDGAAWQGAQRGPAGAGSRVRGATYNYDMTAVATRDTLVRRIIWGALFVVAMLVLLIVTR